MLGGTHLGPSELSTDISPFQTNVMTGTILVVLILIAIKPSGNSEEKEVYYVQAWGSSFIGVKVGGLQFPRLTLYWRI